MHCTEDSFEAAVISVATFEDGYLVTPGQPGGLAVVGFADLDCREHCVALTD